MSRFTVNVLGLEVSFVTDAGSKRVYDAREHVESQCNLLHQDGKNLSKEKLLTVLALSLADDYLQSTQKLRELEEKVNRLLEKIDLANVKTAI